MSLDVLYEDNHLLVLDKPAGVVTMGDPSRPTLHRTACEYLKHKYAKPGNVYLGIVSRLDSMTSGVIVMARTSKAAARLSDQFAGRAKSRPEKIYLAALPSRLHPETGTWNDFVAKDESAHRMRVVDAHAPNAQQAILNYATVVETESGSVVAVQLRTGRKHQIRTQAAHRQCAVIGDRKYGSRRTFPQGIALHSWRLKIEHPTRRQPMWFAAEPPKTWRPLLRHMPPIDSLWKSAQEQLQQLEMGR